LSKFLGEVQKCHDTFERNLNSASKRGISGLVDSNYFGYGLGKSKDQSPDKKDNNDKKSDFDDESSNPMLQSINCFKKGINQLMNLLEERVTHITGDLVEPLDMYINHHEQTSAKQFN